MDDLIQAVAAGYISHAEIKDFMFPRTPSGKGSHIEVLPTGDAYINTLSDIEYFQLQIRRSLYEMAKHNETNKALLDDAVVIYHEKRSEDLTPAQRYERAMKVVNG